MKTTIISAKIVGFCRKHDEEKEFYHIQEKDIACVECSFKGGE